MGILFLGIIESFFLYIQFAKTMSDKDASGVSLFAFMLFLFTSLGWMIWGALAKDIALLVTSFFNVIGAVLVVTSVYLYGGEAYDHESVSIGRDDVPTRDFQKDDLKLHNFNNTR